MFTRFNLRFKGNGALKNNAVLSTIITNVQSVLPRALMQLLTRRFIFSNAFSNI
jgi:hypothetical protein